MCVCVNLRKSDHEMTLSWWCWWAPGCTWRRRGRRARCWSHWCGWARSWTASFPSSYVELGWGSHPVRRRSRTRKHRPDRRIPFRGETDLWLLISDFQPVFRSLFTASVRIFTLALFWVFRFRQTLCNFPQVMRIEKSWKTLV